MSAVLDSLALALTDEPEEAGEPERVGYVEPGIYNDVPEDDYHASPGASKHQLDIIRQKSPAHLKVMREHPRPATDAQRWGRAFHCYALEGQEAFDQKFIILPDDAPSRPSERQINAKKQGPATIEAIEWWMEFDAMAGDRTVLKSKPGSDPFWNPGEFDRIRYMADAINEHPIASLFLQHGVSEQSVYAICPETGLLVRCRIDFWDNAHEVMVDLKMARDASLDGFSRAAADYRYHVQDAFYLDVNWFVGRTCQGFIFIACENEPPYAVGVYALTPKWRNIARTVYEADLRRYAECLRTGVWPAYEAAVRPMELPPYAEYTRIR